MSSKFETDEFLKLRDEWYKKIKESGFEDIEIFSSSEKDPLPLLYGPSSGDLRRSDQRVRNALDSAEYYSLARKHVWTIENPIIRMIWTLHSEGFGVAKIFEHTSKIYQGVLKSPPSKFMITNAITNEKKRMFQLVHEDSLRDEEE